MDDLNPFAAVQFLKAASPAHPLAPAASPSNRKTAGDPPAELAELKKGAQAFEAYFVQSLLKEMRKSIKQSGPGQAGYGGEIYQGLFDEAIAAKMTENGGIGLAEILIRNLSKKT